MANEYLGWFAVECHYTPDQVYDMPWTALARLTLLADDIANEREKQQRSSQPSQLRRMT